MGGVGALTAWIAPIRQCASSLKIFQAAALSTPKDGARIARPSCRASVAWLNSLLAPTQCGGLMAPTNLEPAVNRRFDFELRRTWNAPIAWIHREQGDATSVTRPAA